jgi:hypothetical protein
VYSVYFLSFSELTRLLATGVEARLPLDEDLAERSVFTPCGSGRYFSALAKVH